jgi:hypothetical protein
MNLATNNEAIRELAANELALVQGGGKGATIAGAIVGAIVGAPELPFIAAGVVVGGLIGYIGSKVFHK